MATDNSLDSLVVNTPISREPLENFTKSLPPMGLGYICSEIKKMGKTVELVDAFDANIPVSEIVRIIREKNPSHLIINIFSINQDIVFEILKQIPSSIDIIIGGGVRGIDFSNLLIENKVAIIDGEGEVIIPNLLINGLPDGLSNILVSKDSQYYPESITEIILDHSFFKNDPQENKLGKRESYLIYSRGCIYSCTFCGSSMKMKKVPRRIRTADSLLEEIKTMQADVEHIRFLDDLLIDDSKDIENITHVMSQTPATWSGMISILSVKKASDQELVKIKESGCSELYFGLESGSVKTLKLFNKYSDIDDVIQQMSRVLRLGINAKVFLILGAYKEEIADLEQTYNFAHRLASLELAGQVRFSPFMYKAYEGTQLYNRIVAEKFKDRQSVSINDKIDSRSNDRAQFNMTNGNYSNCSVDEVSDFINKILKLNK